MCLLTWLLIAHAPFFPPHAGYVGGHK